MSIGPVVRRRLSRFEKPAAEAYRKLFFDLDHFGRLSRDLARPGVKRILEIGCGDGAVADRITAAFPSANYVGIDVAEGPGRRYSGHRERAEFHRMYSHELRATDPAPFDLVLIVDVLHHVPDDPARVALLADAAAMTAPGGTVLVKEWERVNSVPYAAGWAANFLVSGDRKARYMVRAELCAHLDRAAAGLTHQGTVQVGPWGCNVVHVLCAALPRTANRPPGRLPGESSTAQNVRTTPPVGVTQLRGVRPAGRMGTE